MSTPESGLTASTRAGYGFGSVATGTFGTVPGLLLLPYLTDTLGIAAAVHCAAALNIDTPCGLATLGAFDLPMPPELLPVDGRIAVPSGPGLGVDWPL